MGDAVKRKSSPPRALTGLWFLLVGACGGLDARGLVTALQQSNLFASCDEFVTVGVQALACPGGSSTVEKRPDVARLEPDSLKAELQPRLRTWASSVESLLRAKVDEAFAYGTNGPATTVSGSYNAYGQQTGQSVFLDGLAVFGGSQSWDSGGRRVGIGFGTFAEQPGSPWTSSFC